MQGGIRAYRLREKGSHLGKGSADIPVEEKFPHDH